VILIHHGELLYDGKLGGLAHKLAPFKLIRVSLANGRCADDEVLPLPAGVEIIEREGGQVTLRHRQRRTSSMRYPWSTLWWRTRPLRS
jgi:ABC-type uncharacterized transport system ATPase subunit